MSSVSRLCSAPAGAVLLAALVLVDCGSAHAPAQVVSASPAHRSAVPAKRPLPYRADDRELRLPILMYHRIDVVRPSLPPVTQRLTVDPRRFAAEMAWLAGHGFHAVSELQAYDALELGRPLPLRPVLITFDDGYRDVLGKAAPVLDRLHMRATAFVITDRISAGDVSFLTWGDLRRLERDGFDIGSHTVTHADLETLAPARARRELVDSRAVLQARLGRPVQWLAYPEGGVDAEVVALARRAGYVLAMTTRPGDLQRASDPLELRRYEVLDTTSVGALAAMVGHAGS